VNWRAIDANPERVWLPTGFALSLNGIAQGHAADAVRRELRAMGIRDAMLDTGETAVLGQAPDRAPWRFAIEDVRHEATPAPVITVPDGYAAATSSDAHTTFTADRVHHHILDPRSGDSPTHWSSVTVVARSAALADGLTKVFFMLPKEQVAGAARHWGVSVALQDKAGQWLRSGRAVS
jgi:thiamine biosynthesis lipoprotein